MPLNVLGIMRGSIWGQIPPPSRGPPGDSPQTPPLLNLCRRLKSSTLTLYFPFCMTECVLALIFIVVWLYAAFQPPQILKIVFLLFLHTPHISTKSNCLCSKTPKGLPNDSPRLPTGSPGGLQVLSKSSQRPPNDPQRPPRASKIAPKTSPDPT